jgi:hypothetical protein
MKTEIEDHISLHISIVVKSCSSSLQTICNWVLKILLHTQDLKKCFPYVAAKCSLIGLWVQLDLMYPMVKTFWEELSDLLVFWVKEWIQLNLV